MTPLLRISDTVTAPPGKWRWTCGLTGHHIESFSYSSWLDQIKAFHKANEFPLSENWQAEAIDQLCKLLPPGHCLYDDGSAPKHYVNARIGINEAINGTKAIGSFILNGAHPVDQGLAESRAKTCAACFMSVPTQGCSTCYALASMVTGLAGNLTTKSDPHLQGKVCAAGRTSSGTLLSLRTNIACASGDVLRAADSAPRSSESDRNCSLVISLRTS